MRILSVLFVFYLGLFSGLTFPDLARSGVARGHAGSSEGDAFSFNGRIMFYNWGDRADVPGRWKSEAWPTLGDFLRSKGREQNTSIGADCDFLGGVSMKYLSDTGILYGLRFQLTIPEIANSIDEGKAVVNNGNSAFIVTPFGKFSMGYQEGVESAFADIGNKQGEVFDDFMGGRDPTLVKYKLPLLKGDFFKGKEGQWLLHNSVILYPGLYSENVFRVNNHLNYHGSSRYSKYYVNSLPFRVSYQSPKIYGMRFGLSYSPEGYRDGLFEGVLVEDKRALRFSSSSKGEDVPPGGAPGSMDMHWSFLRLTGLRGLRSPDVHPWVAVDKFIYAPSYKGIVSAVWSLDKEFKMVGGGRGLPLKTRLLLMGEYASAGSRLRIPKGISVPRGWFRDLAAAGVLVSGEVGGLALMGSYGYLGRSGYHEGPIDGTVLSYEKRDALSVLKPSYYFVLGGRYRAGPMRVEVSHFYSVKGGYLSLGRLRDYGARVGYELYKSASTKCEFFIQLQRVSARYSFARGFVENAKKTVNYSTGEAVGVSPMKYGFDVFTAGVKVVF